MRNSEGLPVPGFVLFGFFRDFSSNTRCHCCNYAQIALPVLIQKVDVEISHSAPHQLGRYKPPGKWMQRNR